MVDELERQEVSSADRPEPRYGLRSDLAMLRDRLMPALRWLINSRPARMIAAATVCALAIFGLTSSELANPGIPTTLADTVLPPPTLVIEETPEADPESAESAVPETAPRLLFDPQPFFVSPSLGDDGNPGSSLDAPWASLKQSLLRLEPGQTLYLMDGEYRETTVDNFHYVAKASGRPDAWIRITAAPGHSPTLVPTSGTAFEVQGNYVEVSGLTVRGEGFDENNSFGVGLSIRRSHHVRLINNTISNMPLAGVSAIESSNVEVLNNEVFENARWSSAQGSGISIWHSLDWEQLPAPDGYHDRIIGNTIYRNENRVKSKWKNFTTITDGNGIIIDQNRDFNYSGRTLIANNVVFDNGGRAILVFESNRVDVMYNTTYHNGWTDGLEGGPVELAAGTANDVRFINNLAWALPGAPAMVANASNQVERAGNVLVTTNPSGAAGSEDLVVVTAPGLVNPSTDENVADFRPLPTGVLAGRALPLKPLVPFDAAGQPRSAESADVGAYEIDIG